MIKGYLINGRNVLFVGLPCQVAAVKGYVGSMYDKHLYTIDLICHGTPSPKILDIFLAQYGLSTKELSDIQFRHNKFSIIDDMKYIVPKGVLDAYSMAFLNSVCYTENCYHCHYASLQRVSDITLGDSWGSQLSKGEQLKGISLILCQTLKGEKMLEQTAIELMDVDLDRAVAYNHQLKQPSVKPVMRETFFRNMQGEKKFNSVVRRLYLKQSIRQIIKLVLIKIKILRGGRIASYGISYSMQASDALGDDEYKMK